MEKEKLVGQIGKAVQRKAKKKIKRQIHKIVFRFVSVILLVGAGVLIGRNWEIIKAWTNNKLSDAISKKISN